MAVQFNLLPDVKLEYDRQQRMKRFVYTLSMLVSGLAIALVVVSFFSVNILQKKLLNDADSDIKKYSKQLKDIPDLEKVLTIQNQLNALPKLHQSKHVTSRLFSYLPQITPPKVFIGQITLDTNAGTISISGTADKLETVNQLVDTLKFTNLKSADGKTTEKAFSDVVLASASRTTKGASYTVNFGYDPALFDISQSVDLVVPNEITTRSVTESPNINNLLFNGDTGKPANDNGGQ